MKKNRITVIAFLICALIATGIYYAVSQKRAKDTAGSSIEISTQNNSHEAAPINNNADFIFAARAVTPAVVHIKTTYDRASTSRNPYDNLYGSSPLATGSASGVTISEDGFIATNNHVVENATRIEVIFPDRREFAATLVGTDPNTDLALIKVSATGLPFVKLGNSDNVEVGQWVLAVGYPFSLNTTVTAGIISAKGRSIGIVNRARDAASQGAVQQTTGIESFLQTDAAINPGNSGGALVNTSGELVGINTAIASMTGSYAGYAFAIPVNLAKKILDDIREFGTVKRGILGVSFPAPSSEDQYLQQQGIRPGSVKGVFITGIQPGSAAANAGLKEGDIIQSIDGVEIFSSPEFSERIARHRPGDKVVLVYLRNGKRAETTAVLKAEEDRQVAGSSQSLTEIYRKLGAKFSPLSSALKERFNLDAGVVVTEVLIGGFFDQVGIPPGTIIAYINGKAIYDAADIDEALLSAQNGRILILGIAPDGSRVAFNFSLGT